MPVLVPAAAGAVDAAEVGVGVDAEDTAWGAPTVAVPVVVSDVAAAAGGAAGATGAVTAGALAGLRALAGGTGDAVCTSSRATAPGLALLREDCRPSRSARRLNPSATKSTMAMTSGPARLER